MYLAVAIISISSHEVDPVAVFVPERSLIWQGAVGDRNVVVIVVGGKWASMVVGHGIPYRDMQHNNMNWFFCISWTLQSMLLIWTLKWIQHQERWIMKEIIQIKFQNLHFSLNLWAAQAAIDLATATNDFLFIFNDKTCNRNEILNN